jgi:RNA polymerase sigma factor (sigma-70 family)
MLRSGTDHTCWEAALLLQRSWLLRYCRRLTSDAEAAEDLVQETLYEAWRHLHALHEPAGLDRWLAAIARNVYWRWARRRGQERAHTTPEALTPALLEELVAGDNDLEVDLERAELATLLDRALALLPADTRAALVQRYVEERPQAEIARRLGVREGAVEARLQRGKLALRRVLTTTFAHESVAYGLIGATDHWQTTRLWCPGCGRRRLEGQLRSERGELRLRCPDGCAPLGGALAIDAHVGAVLRGVRTFKPAATRVLAMVHDFFQICAVDGVMRCPGCRAAMPVTVGTPLGRAPGAERHELLSFRCPTGEFTDRETWHSLIWSLPEARRFWQAHPRMRSLPARAIEVGGHAAVATGFESVTDGARFEAVALRATGRVLSVNGAPRGATEAGA